MSNWVMINEDDREFLAHSSGPWKNHKYISKDGKKYIYRKKGHRIDNGKVHNKGEENVQHEGGIKGTGGIKYYKYQPRKVHNKGEGDENRGRTSYDSAEVKTKNGKKITRQAKVGEPKEVTNNKPHGRNTGNTDKTTAKRSRVKSAKELHNPSSKRTTSREFTLKGDKTITVRENSRSGKSGHEQTKRINIAADTLAARTKKAKEKLRKAKKK